ncbi:MAG: hypothetical protein PHI98_07990 [Eubacteriales bacterium]|nr:hypothetical protein [Eubacteriales bacterium]
MEKLYNGIVLPEEWPPRQLDEQGLGELPVPYLRIPPQVVEIDLGRQLFVDDFLIEDSWLEKRYHPARLDPEPILFPETPMEMNRGVAPVAAPFTDGCWYDPIDGVYRLYYHAGWFDGTALAVSMDGKHFVRKRLDNQIGTNRIFQPEPGWQRDGSCVWLDQETDHPDERYKMFHYFRTPQEDVAQVAVSADGLHWSKPVTTGVCGDNTSFFYNSFRRKWVFSIRTGLPTPWYSRGRSYYECDRFLEGASWAQEQIVFWQRCDQRDLRECEPGTIYNPHLPPQLYHLNCVAYESVLLGMFAIVKGLDQSHNASFENSGVPKRIDLYTGFSRDGFHFSRDSRKPFIRCSDQAGDWARGYLHACGGLCLVSPDELCFPIAGFSGASPAEGGHVYGGAATGLARLRRDGFASLHANGTVQGMLSRRLRFMAGRFLFINASALSGFVRAQLEDENGCPLPGFTFDDCTPMITDSTKAQLHFRGGELSTLCGKIIRIRFELLSADLYSFWISGDETGKSGGYVAAGGSAYPGARDI